MDGWGREENEKKKDDAISILGTMIILYFLAHSEYSLGPRLRLCVYQFISELHTKTITQFFYPLLTLTKTTTEPD